jgi:hypothetical protein
MKKYISLFSILLKSPLIIFQIARDLQLTIQPYEDFIPESDLRKYNLTACRNLDMYNDDE